MRPEGLLLHRGRGRGPSRDGGSSVYPFRWQPRQVRGRSTRVHARPYAGIHQKLLSTLPTGPRLTCRPQSPHTLTYPLCTRLSIYYQSVSYNLCASTVSHLLYLPYLLLLDSRSKTSRAKPRSMLRRGCPHLHLPSSRACGATRMVYADRSTPNGRVYVHVRVPSVPKMLEHQHGQTE